MGDTVFLGNLMGYLKVMKEVAMIERPVRREIALLMGLTGIPRSARVGRPKDLEQNFPAVGDGYHRSTDFIGLSLIFPPVRNDTFPYPRLSSVVICQSLGNPTLRGT